jgi:hypothetical protein
MFHVYMCLEMAKMMAMMLLHFCSSKQLFIVYLFRLCSWHSERASERSFTKWEDLALCCKNLFGSSSDGTSTCRYFSFIYKCVFIRMFMEMGTIIITHIIISASILTDLMSIALPKGSEHSRPS